MGILKKLLKIIVLILSFIIFQYYKELGIENSLNDNIVNNTDFKNKFLDNYINLINRNKYEKKCNKNLAFSFCSCIDVVVSVYDLLDKLKSHHNFTNEKNMKKLKKLKAPKTIKNFNELELFLKYYLYTGAGTEKLVENKEIFEIIKKLSLEIKIEEDLGGNSTMMAERSYKENCNTLLGAKLNKDYFKKIYNENIELVEETTDNLNDYHLVIQYQKNKQILGINPNRFNRIYLNHDIDNSNFDMFSKMMKKIDNRDFHFVILSCFQLLDLNSDKKNKNLIKMLKDKLTNSNKNFHIELATISDKVWKLLGQHIIPITQSLGLNEQELLMIWNYFKKEGSIEEKKESYFKNFKDFFLGKSEVKVKAVYGINSMIEYLTDLLKVIDKNNFKTNRIHVHSINQHMICHKRSIYQHSRFAMSKGILASLNIVFQKEFSNFDYLKDHLDEFLLRIPKIINLIKDNNKIEQINFIDLIKNPNYCWHYNVDWKCCIGLTVELIKPKRVRGLGDNISTTGLIYTSFK